MPSRKVKRTELSLDFNGSAGLARHFPELGILAQGMHRSGRDVEVFAGDDEESLQGAVGHGANGFVHARGQGFGVVVAAAHVGKDQQGVTVKGPVAAQLLV